MKFLRNDPRTIALGATALLLVAVVSIEIAFPFDADKLPPETGADEPRAIPEADTTRYVHPPFEAFSAVLDNALFFPDRTLPPKPVVTQAAPRTPLNLVLEGIAIVGEARIAVLKDPRSKRLVQLSAGAEHGGWTLEEISADGATFVRDGESIELRLDDPE